MDTNYGKNGETIRQMYDNDVLNGMFILDEKSPKLGITRTDENLAIIPGTCPMPTTAKTVVAAGELKMWGASGARLALPAITGGGSPCAACSGISQSSEGFGGMRALFK